MITKKSIRVSEIDTPQGEVQIETKLIIRASASIKSTQCDTHSAKEALIAQTKRHIMQQLYSDITQDLTSLRQMTGLQPEAMTRAINDVLDKYTGVIDG